MGTEWGLHFNGIKAVVAPEKAVGKIFRLGGLGQEEEKQGGKLP